MKKVLNFGELLLHFCPDNENNWLSKHSFPFYLGGAELNVATALALWGVPSKYFTAIPDNYLSEAIISHLNTLKIDTTSILKQGSRIGTYYLNTGNELKDAGVIYDRDHSSYSALKPQTVDWDEVFTDVNWFHFSTICPALTQNVADVCLEAVKAASEKNIKISIDLNYRSKLWKYGKEPIDIIPSLAQYCTLIMGNIWAAEKMLGIKIDENLIVKRDKKSFLLQSEQSSKEIINRFDRCETVANTFRFDNNATINYYSTLYTENRFYTSLEYSSNKILNKVGSGDCFMAGLIYGYYKQHEASKILNFATAAAFDKLFIPNDATKSTTDEITQIIKNGY